MTATRLRLALALGVAAISAVRDGRIYVPPDVPFGWFDSPPSRNRLLGVQWLARILYPQLFPSLSARG